MFYTLLTATVKTTFHKLNIHAGELIFAWTRSTLLGLFSKFMYHRHVQYSVEMTTVILRICTPWYKKEFWLLIFSLSNKTWWFVEGIEMCIWASTSITEGKCRNFCYLCSCPTCHSECTVVMLLLHEPITYWMLIYFLDIFGWVKYFNMWRIIQGIHCWQDISGRGNWMCLFHLLYVAYFCLFHFFAAYSKEFIHCSCM